MRLIRLVAIGIVVLGGTLLGCGNVEHEEMSTVVRAATSVDPSQLSFSRAVIPPLETLRSIAFGNGKFVAVGSNATVEISGDGVQWAPTTAPFAGNFQSIVFRARTHLFYALVTDPSSAPQRIYSSADGKNWTLLSSLALVGRATLSLANDVFFASGHDSSTGVGAVFSSSDARTWARSATSLADSFFDEVVFGAGRYAAHASDEDGNSAVWISFNASTWQLTHGLGQGGSAIAFGAGKFVAGRDRRLESSPDGINWTVSLDTEGSTFTTLLFSGGFRAFDIGGAIWTSPDAVTWTQTAGAAGVSVLDVAVSGSTYVGVGNGGSLARTTTLGAWTAINPPGGVSYKTIAFGSGKFVMADRGRLQTSTDAVNWKTVVPLTAARVYRSVKRVGNAFFAIYDCGEEVDTCIADSSDGINWAHALSFSEEEPRDIAFGNGKYVFVQTMGFISNFTSFCCLDTFNNDVFELPSGEAFVAVAFGAGKFVAVTPSGQIVTSTDATNWQIQSASGLSGVTSLAFGNGRFVAATASGVFSSTSGTTFTRVFTPPAGAVNNQIGFASRLFFYTGDAGFLAASSDGLVFTVVPSASTDTIYQVAFGNALYVGGGDHNTVVKSK
jgi:hypothetical protein